MKKNIFTTVFLLVLSSTFAKCPVFAQANDALTTMNQLFKPIDVLNQKYIEYNSAVAHSSARKSERKFRAYMDQIQTSNYAINDVPYYNGDKSLHNGLRDYLKVVGNVMNENYTKVVNLEEIAERSYDAMEAYILLNKKVGEKMDEEFAKLSAIQKDYCKRNNITLVENTTDQNNKMGKISEVTDYRSENYLIFFKCAYQNDELMKAINGKNVMTIEQARTSLKKYAEEGLLTLDTIKNFRGDGTLKSACKKALIFFKREAEKSAIYTDYAMKEQAFNQMKKNFEGNSKMRNDKAEIDKYNKAVNDMNDALKTYNETNAMLNDEREEAYKDYNKATSEFLDTHIPYAKK